MEAMQDEVVVAGEDGFIFVVIHSCRKELFLLNKSPCSSLRTRSRRSNSNCFSDRSLWCFLKSSTALLGSSFL